MYRPTDQEQATGVAAACEQLTGVGAILPTSLGHFHLPPGKPYTSGTVRDTYLPKGTAIDGKTGGPAHRMLSETKRESRKSSPGSQCSGWVRGWPAMVGHVNSDVASIQDGDSPAYYECAIVHTSGPGVFRRPRALHTDTQISLASRPDLE